MTRGRGLPWHRLTMGKSKKVRDCPVLGRGLLAHECASARNLAHVCPEACEYNPLSRDRYDELLVIEDGVDKMLVGRLRDTAPDVAAGLLREIERGDSQHRPHAASLRRLFFERDAEGRSRADRWLADPGFKLKTDERVLIAAKARTRPALLEVQEVRANGRLRMRDLLRPEAPDRELIDRRLATMVGRFSRFLGWVYPLPHFDRLSGTAIIWAPLSGADFRPVEVLLEISAHLGGPAGTGDALLRWIEGNFERVEDALSAVQAVRTHDALSEGSFNFVSHDYKVTEEASLLADLRRTENLQPNEPAAAERKAGVTKVWNWMADAATTSGTPPIAEKILGSVLAGPGRWRLAGMGVASLADLRARFEATAGARATWLGELVENIGGQVASPPDQEQVRLTPPRLREQPMRMEFSTSRSNASGSPAQSKATFMAEHFRLWPDQTLPALGGRTPREMAADPAGRARLVEVVKGLVSHVDAENLAQGTAVDINPLIRELGLTELDVPPPPARPRPATAVDEGELDEDDDDDELAEYVSDIPDWRIGHSRMTTPYGRTLAQVLKDLRTVSKEVSVADIVEQTEREAPEVLDWAVEEASDFGIDDDSLDLLEGELALVWCALTPIGWADDARFEVGRLAAELSSRSEKLAVTMGGPVTTASKEVALAMVDGAPRNRYLKEFLRGRAQIQFATSRTKEPLAVYYALVVGVLLDELLPVQLD